LYGAASTVENALRQTLRSEVASRNDYNAQYDRSADQLIDEQRTTITLGNQQATAIDLHSLFSNGEQGPVEVSLEEGSSPSAPVDIQKPIVPLHRETKLLLIVMKVRKRMASSPLLTDKFWVPFRAVAVHWYLPLASAAVLTVQYPEDATVTWPLSVDITTDASASLQGIRVPNDSFYYASTPMRPSSTSVGDDLIPDDAAPKVVDLAADRFLDIELMPPYLSNSFVQNYKQYLAVENLKAAILFAIASALVMLWVGGKAPPAPRG
jgi:hypothetical protein